MKLNTVSTLFLSFLFPMFFYGQIRVSENIQPSSIATKSENALYFVDFWATWCGPCIHASKYIESLQRQYPEDFYVVSLSQESPEIVRRFMQRHTNGLAVAIDYEGETFAKNNVTSLPYSILYNAKGEKLWEGHPADFKNYQIASFLRENKSRISVNNMIKLQAYEKEVVTEEVLLNNDLEIIELNDAQNIGSLQIMKHKGFLDLKGNLKDILAYTFNVHNSQIELPESLNQPYNIRFKFDTKAYLDKAKAILKALKLKQTSRNVKGEALVFNLNKPTFWDTNQIDWGDNTPQFLIGDSEIKADNVTLNDIKYQLSCVLELPIVINPSQIGEDLHDWDIHYKYYDLMASSLNDNYGIQIKKEQVVYPLYVIVKKGR